MTPVPADKHPGSLRINSLWLLFARLTAQGLGVLFIALAARRLGVEIFGQFTVIMALVLIGNTFTNFGTDTLLIREIARSRRILPLAAGVLGLQLLLSAGWWLATLVFQPGPPLLVYSLALFPLAVFSVSTAVLRAFERMDLFWGLSLANGAIQVLAVWLSNDLWTLCIFLFAGQVVMALLAVLTCSASLADFRLLPFPDIRPLLHLTWPFAALTLLLVLAQRVGVLSVSWLIDDAATGLFSSVTRVVDGLKLGHYAVLGALLPMMARNAAGSKGSFRKGFYALLGLSCLFAISLGSLAHPIVDVLYGRDFVSISGLLSLLGWSLLPYTVSAFISYDLIARGLEYNLLKAALISLVISGLTYFWCISLFGLTGAAWAALTAEFLQAIIFICFVPRMGTGHEQTVNLIEIK
jgi:O-antigen/teichoic acid export membrane protein